MLGIGDQVSVLVGPACGLLVGLVGAPPALLLGLATVPVVGRLRPGLALPGNALLWG
jgi:hypothetical protein